MGGIDLSFFVEKCHLCNVFNYYIFVFRKLFKPGNQLTKKGFAMIVFAKNKAVFNHN